MVLFNSLMLFTLGATAASIRHQSHADLHKRASSLSNVCGGSQRLTCDANSPNGGPCCSHASYCGSSDDYCGDGCQPLFGTCGSNGEPAAKAGPAMLKTSAQTAVAKAGPAAPEVSAQAPVPAQSQVSNTAPAATGCTSVEGLGLFASHLSVDFAQATGLPSWLHSAPEKIAAGGDGTPGGGASIARHDDPGLTTFSGGFAVLTVPGGQSGTINGASFQTVEEDILHASVRTTAILTPQKGVCNGFFVYNDETGQDINIEYLSDPSSTSNTAAKEQNAAVGNTPLFFTNHKDKSATKKYTTAPLPSDATTNAHIYRTDWTDGLSVHYVDDKEVTRITEYVPTVGGPWIWNNWSNGDKTWSVGPPAENAVLKISNVEIFYNTKSSTC